MEPFSLPIDTVTSYRRDLAVVFTVSKYGKPVSPIKQENNRGRMFDIGETLKDQNNWSLDAAWVIK